MSHTAHPRRSFLRSGLQAAAGVALAGAAGAAAAQQSSQTAATEFRRIRTQFIAALAADDATAGSNAHEWGLWRLDPGPRGVRLDAYSSMEAAGNRAPAGWKFDPSDWWLEEHGLIMEAPEFPVPPGRYLVTGDRETVSVLTVHRPDDNGAQAWELSDGANIYDVTHLRCRSARYTPATHGGTCGPAQAKQSDFPVRPGNAMPPVAHCSKQDYAVLLVIARPAT
ncbi:MAG: hypothetical protein PVF63_00860 [Gammaproteobacteria bacterium]|jgi:hypothetical protein